MLGTKCVIWNKDILEGGIGLIQGKLYYHNVNAGVNLGVSAVHPLTGQTVPVFAAEYVVSGYGTEAVMGVPGHDLRDKLFAEEHQLPIRTVYDYSESGDRVLCNSDKVCT